ncbi:hypothetical protein YQE_09741, partial [Dendroctonus ponderosae]
MEIFPFIQCHAQKFSIGARSVLLRSTQSLGAIFSSSHTKRFSKDRLNKSQDTLDSIKHSLSETEESDSETIESDDDAEEDESSMEMRNDPKKVH